MEVQVHTQLEAHFARFRPHIIGDNLVFDSPYGPKSVLYADWIASGRLYRPIEDQMTNRFGPYVGNTHTETSLCGTVMTRAYHEAKHRIKKHVNAGPHDALVLAGPGMTTVINKWIRMLGLRIPERLAAHVQVSQSERPVVFVTHMEHHSNQTCWLETICDVVVIPPGPDGRVDPDLLDEALAAHADRPYKIGAFTACSNVTGVETPYHELARRMHAVGGLCFVDFAASAPYVDIDMHPAGDPAASLDAIYFSPHKFLGGPGTSGVLLFNSALYKNAVPDNPGGGTVAWTNPWGGHAYIQDIEEREDGGTPGFLQAIRTALAIEVKNQMGTQNIRAREEELLEMAFPALERIPKLHVLAPNLHDRLGILSFYFEHVHFNLVVRLLNDRFGIQVRGGCSCAGTYGHFLLHVDPNRSRSITDKIDSGDLSDKPGWVRLSLHPTLTNNELTYILDAIAQVGEHAAEWVKDYTYCRHSNEFVHNTCSSVPNQSAWFTLSEP